MSKERREHEPTPEERMWQPLILAAEAEVKLSPRDEQALRLREAALHIADYIEAVGEGMVQDPAHEAQLLAGYWDGYLTFEQAGIQVQVHVGKPQEAFQDSLTMAEYVAGQWEGVKGKETTPNAQVRRQIQEMTEESHDFGGVSASILQPQHITSQIKDWMVMRSFVNVTYKFLAGDLGRPQLVRRQDQPPTV